MGNNAITQLNPTVRSLLSHRCLIVKIFSLILCGKGVSSFTYNFRPDGDLDRAFNYSIDFFSEPYNYKEAVVANLFYWSVSFPST